MRPTVCLNMIVKDESAIIERCLVSATPHIDCYVICDTGSKDGTPELISTFFADRGIPGFVRHTTFQNFQQARNEALDAARNSALDFDYLLLCDADMELVVTRSGYREELRDDAYYLQQRQVAGPLSYQNLRLLHRRVPARYRGVTHEYLELPDDSAQMFDGAMFLDHAAGSSRTIKFERDVRLLLEGLKAEPDNARYVFYLAQSYRDSGQFAKSLETYERRFGMGGWAEEQWYSKYQIALLGERLRLDDTQIVNGYLAAYELRPQRAEPLYQLARYYREQGPRYSLAHLASERAMSITPPSDRLFVDAEVYAWRIADEYSIACYWTGRYSESAKVCEQLLANPALPSSHRDRVFANLSFARQRHK